MTKGYLSIKQAAEMIGVKPITLRNWDRNRKLPANRDPTNNRRIYTRLEIEKFLEGAGCRWKNHEFSVVLLDD